MDVQEFANVIAEQKAPEPEVMAQVEEVQEQPETEQPEIEENSLETEQETVSDDAVDQEAETTQEEPSYQSLDDFAEALEMSVDDLLLTVKGKVKVNGEVSEVSLKELTDGYQRETDYRRKTMELADQRREFEALSQAKKTEFEQGISYVTELVHHAADSLMHEYQNVNWQQLREEDPAEYSAKLQDFNIKKSRLDQIWNANQAKAQQLEQEKAEKAASERQKKVADEMQLFLAAKPELSDPSKFQAKQGEIVTFLKAQYGFDDAAINDITDHKILLLAMDAMNAKQQKSDIDIAKKKLKPLPKLIKPGVKESKAQRNQSKSEALAAKLKRTGSVDDFTAYLLNR